MAEFLRQFVSSNRMLEGGFVIEDRLVTLADIECPVLTVVGTVDQLAPAAGVRAITQAAPRAEVYELDLPRRALRAGRRLSRQLAQLADGRRVGPLAGRSRTSGPRRPPR